jgi:hypothetical protein
VVAVSRIPDGVLSQCDNQVLMRMNSGADLAQLDDVAGPAMGARMFTFRGLRRSG